MLEQSTRIPTTRGERPRHGETAGEEVSGDFGDIFVFAGRVQRREEAVRTVAENQFSGLQRMASATHSAPLAGSKAGSPCFAAVHNLVRESEKKKLSPTRSGEH